MKKAGWGISVYIIVVAVLLSVLLGWPQPVLDFEGDILPLAHEFMGLTETSPTPLSGLVVVITGATSGIGKSFTSVLSRMGATVVAVGRSQKKLEQLQEEMDGIIPVIADLNDLSSVAEAADQITSQFDHIDVLVNNAGMHAWQSWSRPTTAQHYDQTFGVNYLSHFLLTEKLLPALNNSKKATILQMTSSFHWAVDGADLMTNNDKPPVASIPGGSSSVLWRDQRAYANSKLAQLLHARALVRHGVTKVRVVNTCPGWVGTHIGGQKGTPTHFALTSSAFPPDGWGLASALYALLENSDGDYYINSKAFMIFEYTLPKAFWRPWSMATGLRDAVCFVGAMAMLYIQKFFAHAYEGKSSPESFNIALQDSLYAWSKDAVAEWI